MPQGAGRREYAAGNAGAAELEKYIIVKNAANIIARLHARSKPNEQEKRGLRTIREKDAGLAVQCVGTLLCELGLAEWNG